MPKTTRKDCLRLDPRIFISEAQLAQRWLHSIRSLQRWRAHGHGLPHFRIGRRIVYRIADVEAFEAASRGSGR